MNESQISVRYAKALFQGASELGVVDRVYSDMGLLAETCALDDFIYMMTLPSLQGSQKSRMVDAILKPHLSEISMSMIHLVIRNKREGYLPGIARNFRDLYRTSRGIRKASLVTAQPVGDADQKRIKELITKTYEVEVELSVILDEEMIGGFVITIGDRQYDASIASHLRRMKKQLLQTSVEKK